ncbi:DUF5675 family protein [Paucidesulfovibrio longus]|uniref:DUF5675 family protein n=1 Tax=Paucidesulfovibrio longus TaxID=889 RepID=UPI00058EE906|nr:DUF5675 family protein [Paucidesulfovibrio longus]
MDMDLVRLERSEDGVFGVLRCGGRVVCCTLEPQDLDNRQNVSCIPEGEYVCRRTHSSRFGETFEVCAVPGRDHILFHAGNTQGDTRGCILLGQGVGMLGGVRGIMDSRNALSGFLRLLEGRDQVELRIRNAG